MRKNVGVLVDMRIFDDADHLLFFSHRGEVIANISAWLAARMDRNKLKLL